MGEGARNERWSSQMPEGIPGWRPRTRGAKADGVAPSARHLQPDGMTGWCVWLMTREAGRGVYELMRGGGACLSSSLPFRLRASPRVVFLGWRSQPRPARWCGSSWRRWCARTPSAPARWPCPRRSTSPRRACRPRPAAARSKPLGSPPCFWTFLKVALLSVCLCLCLCCATCVCTHVNDPTTTRLVSRASNGLCHRAIVQRKTERASKAPRRSFVLSEKCFCACFLLLFGRQKERTTRLTTRGPRVF